MTLAKPKESYSHNRANQRFYRVAKGRLIIKPFIHGKENSTQPSERVGIDKLRAIFE